MKRRLGWMADPAPHLVALATALLGVALTLNSRWTGSHPHHGIDHPAGCHACSLCPPEAAAARDAMLIQSGTIDPFDEEE